MKIEEIDQLKIKVRKIEQDLKKHETDKAQLEGRLQTLMEQLKTQFDVADLVAAEAKQKELEAKLSKLNEELDVVVAEIKKALDDYASKTG